jgi:hypothetical protein
VRRDPDRRIDRMAGYRFEGWCEPVVQKRFMVDPIDEK